VWTLVTAGMLVLPALAPFWPPVRLRVLHLAGGPQAIAQPASAATKAVIPSITNGPLVEMSRNPIRGPQRTRAPLT